MPTPEELEEDRQLREANEIVAGMALLQTSLRTELSALKGGGPYGQPGIEVYGTIEAAYKRAKSLRKNIDTLRKEIAEFKFLQSDQGREYVRKKEHLEAISQSKRRKQLVDNLQRIKQEYLNE